MAVSITLLACLALFMSGSVIADNPIHILVDGVEVNPVIPALIENGEVLVPASTVGERLGATVDWLPDREGGGTVYFETFPRMFSRRQTALFQHDRSGDLTFLGPTVAVSNFLSGAQVASLSGKGPVLVRFDILDVGDTFPIPPIGDFRSFASDGFRVAVRIYYISRNDNKPMTVASYQRGVPSENSSSMAWGPVYPEAASSWYMDVIYTVYGKGEPSIVKEGGKEVVTYGINGWEVDVANQQILNQVGMEQTPLLVHGSFGR